MNKKKVKRQPKCKHRNTKKVNIGAGICQDCGELVRLAHL